MNSPIEGQVIRSAAEVYEEFFVPALFRDWAEPMVEAARISEGDRVLDVACGTGVLARAAVAHVGHSGKVVGLDRNDGMLAVAGRLARDVEWRRGQAEALPFPDAAFDAVVSQFGLMFFEDRAAALREMWRVLAPGGRLAVAVWDAIERTPGYAAMTALLHRLFGEAIARELRTPYALGEPDVLRDMFEAAGIPDIAVATRSGTARFPSIESWVHTDIRGWTLADKIDDGRYRVLRDAARDALREFERPDGSVAFRHDAHVVTATKR